jgi:hypothetical protein
MKKFIIALAATTAIGAAAPAAAQYAQGGANIQLRTDQLQSQLQAGVQAGTITRAEAAPLREQLRQLTQLERQYSRNGLTGQERSELQNRMRNLRQGIRMATRGGDSRYGQDDRYGNSGQVIDRNRDGYDDRDLNRDRRVDDREWRIAEGQYDDGRYDRDYDDRNDGYQTPAPQRGGIGGVIDGLLGGGGLRVGQRVSGNLGAVPYQYRDQFRDGNGVYYRADNRAIYQIDARTDTVVRIYSLNR